MTNDEAIAALKLAMDEKPAIGHLLGPVVAALEANNAALNAAKTPTPRRAKK